MDSGDAKMRSGRGNEELELKKIQNKSTKVTAESVTKTREMLRLVHECQDAGVNTLRELYDQGDQLSRTEVVLNDTSEHLDKAQIRINNIEKAETIPCCCIPCLSCFQKNPDGSPRKRSAISRKKDELVSTVLPPQSITDMSNKDTRFFPTVLGTEEEDEIESNLGRVSEHLSQLKGIAIDMGTEVTKQNEQLDKMNEKAEVSLAKLDVATKSTADLVKGNRKRNSCCCCSIS